jgi:hypothetical protein
MLASVSCPASPSVHGHLPVNYVRHIATSGEKLHDLHTGACHLCPAGFRFRILLKPTNSVPVELEIHFPQLAFGSQLNGVTLYAKLDQRRRSRRGPAARPRPAFARRKDSLRVPVRVRIVLQALEEALGVH